jgi:2-polyprenyl-6-methoxyphenol hydroxylase-like FAD-dependent oxidoreductase
MVMTQEREMTTSSGGSNPRVKHAVVVGGSVAGLAAAAALHPHVTRVTVVERDGFGDAPANRRGVPQGHHTHALMTGGRAALDQLLPGFSEAMLVAGAPLLDQPRDVAFLTKHGWLARAQTGVETFFVRRAVLEFVIRSLVRNLPSVALTQGSVSGLLATTDGRRVTGVVMQEPDGARQNLEADLVLDASGRGSKAPGWLETLGHRRAPEIEVQPFLGYASRLLDVPDDVWPDGLRGVIALPYPGATRGAAVLQQDSDYSIVTAAGAAKDYPPGDEEGLSAFLRSSMTPVLWEIVSQAETLTEIVTTRTSTNRLRCYHEMESRPSRFLPIGDALCSLNPAYGQGMTNGARQARLLENMLCENEDIDEVVDRFPAGVAELNAFAWGLATSSDMAFATTQADGLPAPTPLELEVGEYLERVQRAATADPWLVGQLQGAINNMDPSPLFGEDARRTVEEWDGRDRPAWSTDLSRPAPLTVAS